VLVEIWSDVVCPWCYLGTRRFDAALARFDHRDDVQVLRRAFQLDPTAVSDHPGDDVPTHTARLAAKFGTDEAQVRQMHDRLAALGAADGIDYRFDDVRAADTRDAHRLLHLAHDLGRADTVERALFRAVFTDGEPIGDRPTLRRVAVDAGLPESDVDDVLGSDRYVAEVDADLARARELGISGVPFFVLDGRYGVSGAQSVEVLTDALNQAWAESAAG
jgi:predicted DsbA family dithiol-disulfide isomerase